MKSFNWKRTLFPTVFAAGLLLAGVYFASRNPETAPPASRPTADPAEIARTSARAANGDAAAQLQMGLWCLEGIGQRADDRQAAEWLRKAAEAGLAEAQYRLATLYQAGRGVPRDYTNALSWFSKAAGQQHVSALYNLGAMYEAGQGTAPDSQAAARYLHEAAELGDAYAQYNMARRCEEGRGVPRNLVEAWKWYELADAGGVPDTLNARRSLESRLSREELRQARREVEEFRHRPSHVK